MNDFSALDVIAFLFLAETWLAGQRAILRDSKAEYGDWAAIIVFFLIIALAVLSCIQLLAN